MRGLLLMGFWVAIASCLFAQTEVITKGIEQTINVNVDQQDDGQRTVTITKSVDGDEKVIKWQDNGEIPVDIQKLLEEENINVEFLEDTHQENVWISNNGPSKVKGKMLIIKDGEDVKELEWSDGHLPEDVKKLLDEHDIDLRMEHDGPSHKKKRVFKHRGSDHSHNDRRHGTRKKLRVADAYMGAQVETTETGALVLDLMKDSPADKGDLQKGDIITRINGARIESMEDLIGLLSFFRPDDNIKVKVSRDGKNKDLEVTLGKRPIGYR